MKRLQPDLLSRLCFDARTYFERSLGFCLDFIERDAIGETRTLLALKLNFWRWRIRARAFA
jgi:hypothetical protein